MKKNKSFSLLEILIALAILVIGVAAVINLFPIGLRASKRTADFSSAAILAQEKMAEVMYLGYDSIGEIYRINTGDKVTFPSPDDQYGYRIYSDIIMIDTLYKITLGIYWLDRGMEVSETFVTYIADHDA